MPKQTKIHKILKEAKKLAPNSSISISHELWDYETGKRKEIYYLFDSEMNISFERKTLMEVFEKFKEIREKFNEQRTNG